MLAGKKDALALLGMASGAASALPLAAGSPAALAALGATTAGASWLGWKGISRAQNQAKFKKRREDFVLHSDKPFPACAGKSGYRMGITTDHHMPVDINDNVAMRHTAIIGQSGVGKTVLGESLLWQQTARAGGWLFVDAKLDLDTRNHLAFMAKAMGREHDFLVLDTSDASNSNTYNPILRGTGDEVASRLMSLLPVAENNPGADHYRQAANHALSVIISALKAANMAYHFGDLAILLQSARALTDLERRVVGVAGADHEAAKGFRVFLDQYRQQTKEGASIDVKRLKDTLGGMAGRIATFAQGEFGAVMNHRCPEIDLFDVVANNRMLYVMLPTMSKGTAALNLGKMLVSDLRSAVAEVQNLPKYRRPDPPFLAFLDEMGSYVLYDVKTLFEQARSAQICMIPGFQAFANLSVVTADFAEIIIQNTWNKALFKFGSRDAEEAAEIIGKASRFSESFSEGDNEGESSPLLRMTPQQQQSDGTSRGTSFRQAEEYRISPDQLKALGIGECCLVSGSRLFHVKTSKIEYPEDAGVFRVMRREPALPRKVEPAPYADRYYDYLTAGEAQVLESDQREAGHNMGQENDKIVNRVQKNNEEAMEMD